MKTRIFKIFCLGEEGRMYNDTAKNLLNDMFTLPRGNYITTIQAAKTYTKSRYKWYFAHLILTAVVSFNRRGMYQITIEETGETRPCDSDNLHEYLKQEFNPIIRTFDGKNIVVGGSTRLLNDDEFFNEYCEKVMQWLSDRDVIVYNWIDWCELMKEGATSLELANTIV